MSREKNIIIKELVKLFKKGRSDEVRAVDQVSFEIKEGELFGLLGPNGAGKTTLIKCISTLLIPDSGTAVVGGADVLKDPLGVRRLIGVLTGGERSLYWKLTPVENLKYFAALYGVSRKKTAERIDYLLELMDLKNKANERVEKLSSGMKQKLSIARTLIHDPPILLIDEPTLGLDPYFARFIRGFIKDELHKRLGKTILLTTHYMDEADELCERIAFMYNGKIKALDTPLLLKKRLPQEQVLEVKCLGIIEPQIFDSIQGFSNIHITKDNGFTYVRLSTENPEEELSKLINKIRDRAKILSVIVTSPTLEDVFVHLTGASLKDHTGQREGDK
ncbi:MAG TPA: ATP-binding cassette domain-containing protein [candidate division WOR-3 bacterium]|uniref:ATP-binding cassette domain-containing protein n=1 Tax=candidate division WOR-3 bacterium TaxID=2052148 RepID=A0A9C9K157_UNCW3|nr:ATP-binding cassette domain-containing protein [candidate division WOR-3 bacterium]